MRPLGACCKTGWAGARLMGLDPLRVPNGLCESIAPLLPKERTETPGRDWPGCPTATRWQTSSWSYVQDARGGFAEGVELRQWRTCRRLMFD